jgi:hypothetical protein
MLKNPLCFVLAVLLISCSNLTNNPVAYDQVKKFHGNVELSVSFQARTVQFTIDSIVAYLHGPTVTSGRLELSNDTSAIGKIPGLYQGNYEISIVVYSGIDTVAFGENSITVIGGEISLVEFSLNCLPSYIGSWNWVNSSGGIMGETRTPGTVGYRIRIVFKQDGTYEEYRSDTLYLMTQYTIKREKTIYRSDSLDVIHYESGGVSVIFPTFRNTLQLGDNWYDGYCSVYERIQ